MFNDILIILIDIIVNLLQIFLLRQNHRNDFLITLCGLFPHFLNLIFHTLFHRLQQLIHLIECLINFRKFLVIELFDHCLIIVKEKFDLLCAPPDLLQFLNKVPDFLFSDYFICRDVFHLEDFGCFFFWDVFQFHARCQRGLSF